MIFSIGMWMAFISWLMSLSSQYRESLFTAIFFTLGVTMVFGSVVHFFSKYLA